MIIHVPFPDDRGRITGVLYLAMVAYPHYSQAEMAQRWIEALAVLPLRYYGKKLPADLAAKAPRGRERTWGVVNLGLKRIAQRRLPAVYLARRRLAGVSPMDAYRDFLDRTGCDDIDFVKKKCWRDSQPVLAMAFHIYSLVRNKPPKMSMAEWLLNLAVRDDCDWLHEAMFAAQDIAPRLVDAFAPKLLYYPYNVKSPAFDPCNEEQITTRRW